MIANPVVIHCIIRHAVLQSTGNLVWQDESLQSTVQFWDRSVVRWPVVYAFMVFTLDLLQARGRLLLVPLFAVSGMDSGNIVLWIFRSMQSCVF